MKRSRITFGLAGICAVGVLSGFGISYSARGEIKRLEQLTEVQEYQAVESDLNCGCRVRDYIEHLGRVPSLNRIQSLESSLRERGKALLQDPKVQEYLDNLTRKSYGDTIALGASTPGALALMIAFYQRRREQRSSELAQKPA